MHCQVTTAATVVFNQVPQLDAVVQQVLIALPTLIDGWVGLDTGYLCAAESRTKSAVFHDSLFAPFKSSSYRTVRIGLPLHV